MHEYLNIGCNSIKNERFSTINCLPLALTRIDNSIFLLLDET